MKLKKIAVISDEFKELIQSGNYEVMILNLMNQSRIIFPNKYIRNEKHPMQSCSLSNCSKRMGKATVPFILSGECCDQPFRWRWMMIFW